MNHFTGSVIRQLASSAAAQIVHSNDLAVVPARDDQRHKAVDIVTEILTATFSTFSAQAQAAMKQRLRLPASRKPRPRYGYRRRARE